MIPELGKWKAGRAEEWTARDDEIRERYKKEKNITMPMLAKEYNLSVARVSQIIRLKRKKR